MQIDLNFDQGILVLDSNEDNFQFDITMCSDSQLDDLGRIQNVEFDEDEGAAWVDKDLMNADLYDQLDELGCELENGWIE